MGFKNAKKTLNIPKADKPMIDWNITLNQSENDIYGAAGDIFKNQEDYFTYCKNFMKIEKNDNAAPELDPVKASKMVTTVTRFMTPFKTKAKTVEGEVEFEDIRHKINKNEADVMLECDEFLDACPQLRAMFACPMPFVKDGKLEVIEGYDAESGFYCEPCELVLPESVEEAVEILRGMMFDFNFLEESDEARAFASVFTPMLHYAKLLDGRPPVDMTEANASGAGKGFRFRLIAALYNRDMGVVEFDSNNKGVGGIKDRFDENVLDGQNMIMIDNMKGEFGGSFIESFTTENRYTCRACGRSGRADPRDYMIYMTTNSGDLTKDLANRTSPVRIRKQEKGYNWKTYGPKDEWDIERDMKENQGTYLGAVLYLVLDWYNKDQPIIECDDVLPHFRRWLVVMNYFVQHYFGLCDITIGIADIQNRVTNSQARFLRSWVLACADSGHVNEDMGTMDIILAIEDAGLLVDLEIFEKKNDSYSTMLSVDINDEDYSKVQLDISSINKGFGRRLSNSADWDEDKPHTITRSEGFDVYKWQGFSEKGKAFRYCISKHDRDGKSKMPACVPQTMGSLD